MGNSNREARGAKRAGESIGGRFAASEATEASGLGLDADEFGRPPMSLATARRLVAAEQRENEEFEETGSTDEELLVHAANTVSFRSAPGGSKFEDHGDESSQAWKVFLEHVETVGLSEYVSRHPEPEPHERMVIQKLASEGVQLDTLTLRSAAQRNSLLQSDLDGLRVWSDMPSRARRFLAGAAMRAEAPARLAEAGVEYPEDWEGMSGSSKDMWEEHQLRRLSRRSHPEA